MIDRLQNHVKNVDQDDLGAAAALAAAAIAAGEEQKDTVSDDGGKGEQQQLSVIKISDLKTIVKNDIGSEDTYVLQRFSLAPI